MNVKIVHFCYFQNLFPFISMSSQTDDIGKKIRGTDYYSCIQFKQQFSNNYLLINSVVGLMDILGYLPLVAMLCIVENKT